MSKKKWTSLLLTLAMVITTVFSGNYSANDVSAAEAEGKITVYLAAQGASEDGKSVTIGKTPVQMEAGTTADVLVKNVLDASEYKDNYEIIDSDYGPYLESINGMGTEQSGDDWYYWSFYINGGYSQVGMGSYVLQDNDKISLIYSYQDTSTEAKDFMDDPSQNPTEEDVVALTEQAKAQQQLLAEKIYQAQFGQENKVPGIENTNGLYTVFSLLRAGYSNDIFYQAVYEKVERQLKALKEEGKVTEEESGIEITEESILSGGYAELSYAKIVLVLTAMGKDASTVGGFDLIEKMADREVYEASAESYTREATMLLALDSGKYALPVGADYVTRTELVNNLVDSVDAQIATSIKWGVDMAAMTLQPLAPYLEENNLAQQEADSAFDGEKIKNICTRGIHFLESMQSADGLYGDGWSANNVWSLAQVMTTMGQFGISPVNEEDGSDFIKNGKTVLHAVNDFVDLDDETVDSSLMSYQPEQLLRGITACVRVMEQKAALYDATDALLPDNTPSASPEITITPTPATTVSPTPGATAVVTPGASPYGAAEVPTLEKIALGKSSVVVAPGKSVSIKYTAQFSSPSTAQAVVTASCANQKVAKAEVVNKKIKITVPEKAVKGAVTTVSVKAADCVASVRVTVRNRAKSVKARKQTITVKKGKQAKVTVALKGENPKKLITDSVQVYGDAKLIKVVKKVTLQKKNIVFYVKGLKKSKSTVKVKIGSQTAKMKVKVV